jgi:MFS family permease
MDNKAEATDYVEIACMDENSVVDEKRLKRKWDTRVLPVLFLIYFCSFMDRASIGNANIAGLSEDLHLKGRSYNVALALFFVIYIVVDVPAAWIFSLVGRGRFLSASIFFWGWTTFGIGFVNTEAELYALRCVLGLFEGGLTACIFVYLGLFYTRYELQGRIAWFYISAPLSNAVGGLLASGFDRIEVGRYRTWRWIFIIEGAATVLVGVACYFALPNWPSEAKYLTKEEKILAEARTAENSNSFGNEGEQGEAFTLKRATRGIRDWNTAILALSALGTYSNVYAYTLFSPTIIRAFGFSVLKSQLLSVPPYVAATIFIIATCYLSDHVRMRGPFVVLGSVLQALGWIVQLACHGTAVRYFGLFLISCGAFGSIPPSSTWLLNNIQPQLARATAMAFVVATGNCGGIVATFTYIGNKTASTGNVLQLGLSGLTFVCASSLMLFNKWENAKRACGDRNHRLTDGKVPANELGSRHPGFKLSL